MEQCRFYAAGAAALAPALGRLTALTFLDISHNALFGWDGGGQHLAPALARLTPVPRQWGACPARGQVAQPVACQRACGHRDRRAGREAGLLHPLAEPAQS